MAQPIYMKYGNTATISGETEQQGKLLFDYEAKEISIDTDSSTRIVLNPVDDTLSTTSPNPIANSAVTTSIVDTLEDVLATTVDHVPCGTKPIKLTLTVPTFTIETTDWTGTTGNYTATKTWTGLKTTHVVESWMQSADPVNTLPTATEIANEALYQYAVPSATDTIKFRATAVPSATITIRARIVGI